MVWMNTFLFQYLHEFYNTLLWVKLNYVPIIPRWNPNGKVSISNTTKLCNCVLLYDSSCVLFSDKILYKISILLLSGSSCVLLSDMSCDLPYFTVVVCCCPTATVQEQLCHTVWRQLSGTVWEQSCGCVLLYDINYMLLSEISCLPLMDSSFGVLSESSASASVGQKFYSSVWE